MVSDRIRVCKGLLGGRFQSDGGLRIAAATGGLRKEHCAQCVQKNLRQRYHWTKADTLTALTSALDVWNRLDLAEDPFIKRLKAITQYYYRTTKMLVQFMHKPFAIYDTIRCDTVDLRALKM